jgi:hypothetical protein
LFEALRPGAVEVTASNMTVDDLSKIAAKGDEPAFVAVFDVPALVLAAPKIDADLKKVDTPAAGLPTDRCSERTRTFDVGAYRAAPESLSQTDEDGDAEAASRGLELLGESNVVFLRKTDRNPSRTWSPSGRRGTTT